MILTEASGSPNSISSHPDPDLRADRLQAQLEAGRFLAALSAASTHRAQPL
jgi:hypothetical protein